jgi:hypothetical protein
MSSPPPTETLCPACERFIGLALQCSYCGEDARPRRSLLILRFAASLLSVGGILLLLAL